MFRGRKAGPSGFETGSVPATADLSLMDPRRAGKPKSDGQDNETGQCATCNAKIRWPANASEFRCPTCLMVNDTRPAHSANGIPSRDAVVYSTGRTGTSSVPHRTARALPITIERTMAIVNRCIDTYLETWRHQEEDHKPDHIRTPPHSPTRQFDQSSPLRSGSAPGNAQTAEGWPTTPPAERGFPRSDTFEHSPQRSQQESLPQDSSRRAGKAIPRKPLPAQKEAVQAISVRSVPSNQISPRPEAATLVAGPSKYPHERFQSSREEKAAPPFIPASKIFKPLEIFLSRTYGDHESLNSSFYTSQPRMRPSKHADGPDISRDRSPGKPDQRIDGQIQELDAKTLLLGDFAENGMWWTGKSESSLPRTRRPRHDLTPDRQMEKSEIRIGSKSPLINWGEVEEWYNSVIKAGFSWQERALKLGIDANANSYKIDGAIAEGRLHLHRAILKIAETLLKRPGRLLKKSGDVRFLLVLFANPLLYPSQETESTHDRYQDTHARFGEPFPTDFRFNSAWDQGNSFGIIKRIFGLLSNLPGDCHRHLTSWFARYDESRFRTYVEVTQKFLTYRLKRQKSRKKSAQIDPVEGLIPSLSGTNADTSAQLHAALGLGGTSKGVSDAKNQPPSYSEDWQVRAAAKVMALLFSANKVFYGNRTASTLAEDAQMSKRGSISRTHIKNHGQLLSTTDFYNSMVDLSDLVADFDTWETSKSRFAFCQYPFFLSVGSKIRLIRHDAKRQMDLKAREAFFDSLLKNKALEQYLILRVRRDCLVEDSLNGISEVVASTREDIKKGLKVQFRGEEGIDAGGLRKEWFLLLCREIFNPSHGLFLYDEESPFCYFNPHSFETSDRYYLIGAVLGLAIYNSTILDVALPPFLFKKLLGSASAHSTGKVPHSRSAIAYTLKDLAEYRPALARGLRQLLEFDGDVQETFQRDFIIEVERYGTVTEVPLCENGAARPVTNANRAEFVDLYIRYILDTQVSRQFEPFKRGFFIVCGGNALSLFQPEEIELLVRGSDEPLDVPSLKAVASYDNWKDSAGRPVVGDPTERVPLLAWFWDLFAAASPGDQRRLLGFVTGSDRIPAVGAAGLVIRLAFGGSERNRLPIARTCFNLLLLYDYRTKDELSQRLWMAVLGSEGFGLK